MKKLLAPALAALAVIAPSCVKVDNSLGKSLVDKSLLFDTYTVEFPLEEIQLKKSADLSGYSDTHLTLGAVRDETFGLTTRDAAFCLIPAQDTLDLGQNPQAVSFDLYFAPDTISCADDSQKGIIQNIYVTELTATLPATNAGTNQEVAHGTELITDGLPVYDGEGPLAFNFTKSFAQKYVDVIKAMGPVFRDHSEDGVDKYEDYVKALPGIHLATDIPAGEGGRINLFEFSCLSVSSNRYYRNNNIGLLTVHSRWDGVEKDSTFVFVPGEPEFYQEAELVGNNQKIYQFCFNRTGHETVEGPAAAQVLVEGGGGLKPVILASELQRKTLQAIAAQGGSPESAVIVKATILLPFELPEDYDELKYFPSVLSPTIRTNGEDSEGNPIVSFAGLTDASVSSENQGDIDRANLQYAPDITYHLQEILTREDLDTATNADIWLLTIHTEKVAEASGSLYDSEYYQQLMYASYYNSLYGGGYGGYGYGYGSYGYGSYGGYGYSNYYNYMMLAQMMAASQQQSYSYSTELDKDRFYRGLLNGASAARHPLFRITYAIPKG